MSTQPTAELADRQWHIVGRWQQYEGEARANLLRVIAVGAFYSIELMNYHGLHWSFLQMPKQANLAANVHHAVTAIVVAWVFMSLGIFLCLRQRVFPSALKYASTAMDLVLLTSVLVLGDGPRSPVAAAYFVLLALSCLRFSLRLIWFSTGGALAGYLFLLGYDKWFRDPPPAQLLPRYYQLMFLLALLLTGVMLGQVIRRVRRLAEDYAARMAAAARQSP